MLTVLVVMSLGCAGELARGKHEPGVCRRFGDAVPVASPRCAGAPALEKSEVGVCRRFGDASPVAVGLAPGITESSGLAVSEDFGGVLWTHNDSGGGAVIFALSEEGTSRGVVELFGAEAVDWEALSLGPCGDSRCLWAGDIGDNEAHRSSVTVWRTSEPEPPGEGRTVSVEPEARVLAYPDGPRDAEALAVDPLTSDVVIVEKVLSAEPRVYRLDAGVWEAADDGVFELEPIGSVGLGGDWLTGVMVTGADFSPGGQELFLRTYLAGFQLEVVRDAEGRVTGFGPSSLAPVFTEGQCESVAYGPDGRSLWFTCEGEGGVVAKSECVSFVKAGEES